MACILRADIANSINRGLLIPIDTLHKPNHQIVSQPVLPQISNDKSSPNQSGHNQMDVDSQQMIDLNTQSNNERNRNAQILDSSNSDELFSNNIKNNNMYSNCSSTQYESTNKEFNEFDSNPQHLVDIEHTLTKPENELELLPFPKRKNKSILCPDLNRNDSEITIPETAFSFHSFPSTIKPLKPFNYNNNNKEIAIERRESSVLFINKIATYSQRRESSVSIPNFAKYQSQNTNTNTTMDLNANISPQISPIPPPISPIPPVPIHDDKSSDDSDSDSDIQILPHSTDVIDAMHWGLNYGFQCKDCDKIHNSKADLIRHLRNIEDHNGNDSEMEQFIQYTELDTNKKYKKNKKLRQLSQRKRRNKRKKRRLNNDANNDTNDDTNDDDESCGIFDKCAFWTNIKIEPQRIEFVIKGQRSWPKLIKIKNENCYKYKLECIEYEINMERDDNKNASQMIRVQNNSDCCGKIKSKNEKKIRLMVNGHFIREQGKDITSVVADLWINLMLRYQNQTHSTKRPIKISFI